LTDKSVDGKGYQLLETSGSKIEERPKEVRIGLIGCGGIARYHLGNLLDLPQAEVVGLADPSALSIDRLKEGFPQVRECDTFANYVRMLDSVDLDAVEILTPHTLHFEHIMESLRRGLHVLVEKPMVCTVEHAREVVAKSEGSSKTVLVSYQDRYKSEFRYIKEAISRGELGDIQFVSALQCEDWLEKHENTWRQDPALSGGGQLVDAGSHLLDIILWTTGTRATEVFAYVDNLGSLVDINSALAVKLDNGAEASISIVGNSPTWWEDIAFVGEGGAIFYRNDKLNRIRRGWRDILEPSMPPPSSNPDRNFVRAILGLEAVESPPTCGLYVAELTEAALNSAVRNQRIMVKA